MPKASELVDDEIWRARRTEPSRTATDGRLQLAQVLAFVALVAALVGALGPAEETRTTYSWPPKSLPATTPTDVWYTPLLLIRHQPETLAATVPCSLPPPLPAAERPPTVLSTARSPERSGGLAVRQVSSRLVISVGDRVLRRVRLPVDGAGGANCSYRLELGGGRWSLAGGPGQTALEGRLERAPVVSGLFSGLDLRSGTPPAIEVTTAPHAFRTILRQTLAWAVAAACALAALLLVAVEGKARPFRAVGSALRTAAGRAHPVDAVVGLTLLGWWVLSPAFADDGWIVARERMFSVSGGFSHYYTAFGANLPNDYWLEWLQHWLAEGSLLVLRIPSLLCLAATWVLCRWILARVLHSSVGESGVALWALASTFLAVALAWGMTLRPEPVTALIVTAVFACAVRFLERGTAAPLAVSAILVPLGLTAHHAAVTAFAPLLVAAPAILSWVRTRIAAAATMFASSIALLVVLLFVGADLEQRRADARIAPLFQPDASWRDELLRYVLLLDIAPFATPLRRASVALMVLAVLAFLLRSRRARQPLLDLPAASLGLALLLFVATPTKHAWHFGAVLGLASLAVAAETARLRLEATESRGWAMRPLVALGAAILVTSWSWFPRHPWNQADLRTLDWTLGFERSLDLSTLAVALPLVLLLSLMLIDIARGRRARAGHVPGRIVAWMAALVAGPLILFTVALLVADATKTDSWTLTRQNLGALTGDAGCGLADDLVVPIQGTARPLEISGRGDVRSLPVWVPPTPVERLPRFALGPPVEGSPARSPWFRLPSNGRVGIFVSGTPSASDRLELEWGGLREGGVERLGRDEISARFASEAGAALVWHFLAAGELPSADREANVMRVSLRSDVAPGAAFAVTAPFTYSSEGLAKRLERLNSRSLVMPSLATFFPCARLPLLSDGIVEAPREIILPRDSTSPLRFAGSPFEGVLDLYGLERLPLADSENPPSDIVVFGLDEELPGGAAAVPTRSVHVSSNETDRSRSHADGAARTALGRLRLERDERNGARSAESPSPE